MVNSLKTTVLLGALTGLIIMLGGYFGGNQGLMVAFFLAAIMNVGSYWFSDKIVLAIYRARKVEEADAPQFHTIVRRLCQRAGLPMPRLYMIPSDAPNAFATGRNPHHAAVAVTEGLLRLLSAEEVDGVLAHELSHVKHRDILVSSIAATLAGVILILANMARWAAFFGGASRDDDEGGENIFGLVFLAILAPIAATIIQLAISRAREYMADAGAATLTRNPDGLADALEKLHYASQRLPMEAGPSTAHLFIVNPLSGRALLNLFSTHPPIEERVRRLRSMSLSRY